MLKIEHIVIDVEDSVNGLSGFDVFVDGEWIGSLTGEYETAENAAEFISASLSTILRIGWQSWV